MKWLSNLFRRNAATPAPVPTPAQPSATRPMARGERNKNWGNIDFNRQNPWVGQVGIEATGNPPRFAVFQTPEHGIRAAYRLLNNYQRLHGLNTIRGMISRWAPTNENNTEVYVNFVASRSGYRPDVHVDMTDEKVAAAIIRAMVQKELGYLPPDADAVIARGIAMGKRG